MQTDKQLGLIHSLLHACAHVVVDGRWRLCHSQNLHSAPKCSCMSIATFGAIEGAKKAKMVSSGSCLSVDNTNSIVTTGASLLVLRTESVALHCIFKARGLLRASDVREQVKAINRSRKGQGSFS